MLAAQDPPSVVRAALHFIDDVVVSLSSSSSDNTLCELAGHMLTTKLVPAMLSSLAGLVDPMDDDDDAAGTRARLVDVLTAAMTTVSHRALKHVDALCSFVATTLKRPRRRRRHVASVGAVDDENPNDVGATEVSLALYVMSIALTHAYDEYHVRFVRDGVYQALEGVAQEPPVATANTHAATQLLATYKSNATTTPALDALAALARDLRGGGSSSNAGVGAVVLRLADVFSSTDGVTSYELTTSAVVPALVEFIQASTDDFGEMVATMSDLTWVVALVATVKEAVVSQWNPYHLTRPGTDGLFPSVVASMTTSGRPVVHVMNLLAQHLNVRLHVNPTMGSPAIADTTTTTVVLVEPLARVDTMQAFVAAKMFGKDQHHHNDDDDEEDVTEMQEGDGEDKARIRTTVDGHVLPPSMTILEALIRSKTFVVGCADGLDVSHGDHPPGPNHIPPPATNCHDDNKNARGSVVEDCLALLALLYKMSLVPPTTFESPALAMHLQRTCLMQPLVVALQAFPWAVRTIAHSYSFLLPFQAKLHLMYASSFGSARAIQYLSRTLWKLPGGRRPDTTGSRRRDDAALAAAVARVAKIPRLKVRVARSKLLQSAMKLLSTYGGQKSIVEIEYLGEVGTAMFETCIVFGYQCIGFVWVLGLGPTTEFYSLVSQAMQAKYLNMWRDEESSSATDDAESEPPPPAAATPPQEPPPHHAMPVRGFHRVVVIVCNTCAHLSIPTCPTHQCLLTQPIDGSHSSSSTPSGTPEPHCHACSFSWSMHQCRHATTTSPSPSGSLDTQNGGAAPHSVSWRWWIVSDSEVAYLSQAYPRGTPSVVHPVLQCSHCDTVTFPGTEAGLVTMVDGGTRMVARTGRRMYERDYRAVTKHASVHCEGTPLTQTNVVLYESDVDTLVALVPQSPEVLDSELDGLGVTSSFQTDLDDAVVAPHGLFPRPIGLRPPSPLSSGSSSSELLARFAFLGKLVAQALVDERLLDLPLAVPFLRLLRGESLLGNMALALEHIATVDPQLGRSLQYLYDHRQDASIDDKGA
ncbi:hypothetical protein DYB25_011129, partial [Aphanomyces astaci]